jgi:hypothetical protein
MLTQGTRKLAYTYNYQIRIPIMFLSLLMRYSNMRRDLSYLFITKDLLAKEEPIKEVLLLINFTV